MIEERDGDIFKQADLYVIAHQANCFHAMGSGIARIISEKFPEAYEADCETVHGDKNKLGTYSCALTRYPQSDQLSGQVCIANIYGQYRFGGRSQTPPTRDTSYDSLYDGVKLLRDDLTTSKAGQTVIGIPYGIGSDLGGASWRVVREMLFELFDGHEKLTCVICRLPGTKDLS
ncbi:MAG: hypothetical protein ACXACA_02900 [Candidatus Ranarchaeia archaeon]|jgi:hypothetical protein